MAPKSQNKSAYTVTCACGARLTLDAGAFSRARTCRNCGASVTLAWGSDRKSGKTVPVAVTREGSRKKPFWAVCGCGYTMPLSKEESRSSPTCPGCGKAMAVEKAPDPRALAKVRAPVKPPSKPLVPLHLRPPVKTAIRAGDKSFECPCGERLLVRPDSERRPIQCYKCGRFHTVQAAGAPVPPPRPMMASSFPEAKLVARKPPPKPAPKSADTGRKHEAGKPSRPLGLGEVACVCGNVIPPRTSRTGREFTCSQCGRKGRVEDSIDPKTKELALKPVFTSGPGSVTPAPSVAPPPKVAEAAGAATVLSGWTCVCGASIDSQKVLAQREIECGGCGRLITLEKGHSAHSTTMRMRPVVTERRLRPAAAQTPPPALPEAPEPPPAPRPSPMPPPTDSFNLSELVPEPPGEEAPARLPADAQIALCECGAELLISRDDTGCPIQCPACDMRMTVEEVPDLITGYSTLRIRTIGKMDEETWSLDDFK